MLVTNKSDLLTSFVLCISYDNFCIVIQFVLFLIRSKALLNSRMLYDI